MKINQAWTREEGKRRVEQLFTNTFKTAPDGIWAAPGRVNLIGEHVDYNQGICLPMALPHATYAAFKRVHEDDFAIKAGISTEKATKRSAYLISAQEKGVQEIDLDQVKPGAITSWPAYVVGVAWALEQLGLGKCGSFAVAIDSCVPYGAGLSSSAALEAAVALPLASDLGLDCDDEQIREKLVTACIMAENHIAGANTGGLDQSAVLLARKGCALAIDFASGARESIPFELADKNLSLLVIDTKAPHSLNDGQYASRRASCEKAAEVLGLESLRQIDLDTFITSAASPELTQADKLEKFREKLATEMKLDAETIRRVEHVVEEIKRTELACELLKSTSLKAAEVKQIGELFNQSHASLRDLYQVTCKELDLATETALANGAYGARMTGGGFGGSAIALLDRDQVEQVMQAITKAFAQENLNQPHFLIATPEVAAARVA